jgi:hypothetical protein
MIAAAAIGLSLSSATPVGIAVSTVIPAIVMRQKSRRIAYTVAAMYFAAALWPLVPGARNFFGPDVSALVAIGLWISSSLLLSSPWLVVWSTRRCEAIWRAPAGIAVTVFPPLGIIGWASPLTAAGVLFPGTAWCGILLCFALAGSLPVWPWRTAAVITGISVVCNISFHAARPPLDWEAINTAFGGIAHGNGDPIAEYRAAQWIQKKALTAAGKVLIFPETVVPIWTPATDAFWQQTLDQLRSRGKTILVGARVPATKSQVPVERNLFSADLAALRGEAPQLLPISGSNPPPPAIEFAYDNAVVVRGAETGVVRQRIPVPIAMWNPLKAATGHLNLNSPGIIDIHGQRAAVLICYEQLLTGPLMLSLAQQPTILIAVANDHWAAGTPIQRFQLAAVSAWARLFSIPYLSAVNK